MSVLIVLLLAALVVSLMVLSVFRNMVLTLARQNERLEQSIYGLNAALLSTSRKLKQLERESVPIVQAPTNEEINTWFERAGR